MENSFMCRSGKYIMCPCGAPIFQLYRCENAKPSNGTTIIIGWASGNSIPSLYCSESLMSETSQRNVQLWKQEDVCGLACKGYTRDPITENRYTAVMETNGCPLGETIIIKETITLTGLFDSIRNEETYDDTRLFKGIVSRKKEVANTCLSIWTRSVYVSETKIY